MAFAVRKNEAPREDFSSLEENGVVRSTVFPNRLRDVRREKGFHSLTDFYQHADEITYSRLAKIERGQIFPRADELLLLANKLECSVDDLLIDVTDPKFDVEEWAKDHVEASLAFRGGAMQDMRIGAALRLRRHELKRSTTDMKEFGLPAATVSRIENADRPFGRWSPDIIRGVKKVFGVSSMVKLMEKVDAYEKSGELQSMMQDLFSVGSLMSRQAGPFAQLASALPGEKGRRIARSIEIQAISAENEIAPVREAISQNLKLPVFEGVSLSDGSMVLKPTKEKIARRTRSKTKTLAIRPDRQILGAISPNSVMIFEKADPKDLKSNMVVAILGKNSVSIGSLHKMGAGLRVVMSDSDRTMPLSEVQGELVKMSEVTYLD